MAREEIRKHPASLIEEADAHWATNSEDRSISGWGRMWQYHFLMDRDRKDMWQCARWAADYLQAATGKLYVRPYQPKSVEKSTQTQKQPYSGPVYFGMDKSALNPTKKRNHGDD